MLAVRLSGYDPGADLGFVSGSNALMRQFSSQPVPSLFLFTEQIARNLFGTPVLLGALIWRPEEDFP
jgi:hypothetical protein